jgi:hypothetical protein
MFTIPKREAAMATNPQSRGKANKEMGSGRGTRKYMAWNKKLIITITRNQSITGRILRNGNLIITVCKQAGSSTHSRHLRTAAGKVGRRQQPRGLRGRARHDRGDSSPGI